MALESQARTGSARTPAPVILTVMVTLNLHQGSQRGESEAAVDDDARRDTRLVQVEGIAEHRLGTSAVVGAEGG
jgi:hypothetical protein